MTECFTEGKAKQPTLNQDAFVITEDFIAVIDGASSAMPFDGVPGGLCAKNILAEGVGRLDRKVSGFEAICELNALLREAQEPYPFAQNDPARRMMASIVMYSAHAKQVWSYGDCSYMVNGKEYRFDKKIDTLNACVRSFVNQAEMVLGRSEGQLLEDDTGARYIADLLNYQPLFANKSGEFGYPILDGFELREDFFVSVAVRHGDTVVLATDGYPVLRPTLAESERLLKDIVERDPLMVGKNRSVIGVYSGLGNFDDRTFVKFLVD